MQSERKASGPKGRPELQKAKQDGEMNSPLQGGEKQVPRRACLRLAGSG